MDSGGVGVDGSIRNHRLSRPVLEVSALWKLVLR